MSGTLDRGRARELMQKAGMKALVICSPENFYYASGFSSMLLDLYRQAPLGLVVLPADEKIEPALIVPEAEVEAVKAQTGYSSVYSFPIWWEVYPLKEWGKSMPELLAEMGKAPRIMDEQYDAGEIFSLLQKVLAKYGLDQGCIGIEQEFISAKMFALLEKHNPGVDFADSTALLYELRKVKSPREIENLQTACTVTESGLVASARAVEEGASIPELTFAFQSGVFEAVKKNGLMAAMGTIEGQPDMGMWGETTSKELRVRLGSTIKYDMQVSINRYHSDVGRTILYSEPFPEQQAVIFALMEAHQRMKEVLYPGHKICEIYQAARGAIERGGFPRHSRGHFGHSVGLDPKIEEPPFISATNETLLEVGMVLAVETPFYFDGIGKFQFENMAVITPNGPVIMNQLPMDWRKWL
jgi:Xaa-Pro dipeptidase